MPLKIGSRLTGEAWPAVRPFEDPGVYGSVELQPRGSFKVRSFQTFSLIYTAGPFGVDDKGGIRISFRHGGALQTHDPSAPNYVSAHTSNGTGLILTYSQHGHSPRPRRKSLNIQVVGGYLAKGDTITVIFGDKSSGSPGLRLQSFAESSFEFMVLADPCSVGHYQPLFDSPSIAIIPAETVIHKSIMPSLRRPGEYFRFGLRAEDQWGNPTPGWQGQVKLKANQPIKGLPNWFKWPEEKATAEINGLCAPAEGTYVIEAFDQQGRLLARSNPMVVRTGPLSAYWGDLHGQSAETIGTGTVEEYFEFALNKAFLDVSSHQGNDFQITPDFWAHLNRVTATYQKDNHFVTFPGYEWSGNTAVGGDRNIYFKTEGRQIRRSSHALLTDRSDSSTDVPDARALFKALQAEDCLAYAHAGGRYANLAYAHEPRIETAMEIHSAWGTFEWLLADCFELGHRVGVVANSDDHKGRPGASHPGASHFGAYGGLTCFLAEELTREGIFECMRQRRHYATTGARLHLDVRCLFNNGGEVYDRDPKAWPNAKSRQESQAAMGSIASTSDQIITLAVEVTAMTGIERIEVLNGMEVVDTFWGYDAGASMGRIKVMFSGAEYRGRGRQTNWRGWAQFTGTTISNLRKINVWSPERLCELTENDVVQFDLITSGNLSGFEVWIGHIKDGELKVETKHGSLEAKIADLYEGQKVFEAGGLDRRIKAYGLPGDGLTRDLKRETEVVLKPRKDNPLWIRVTLEDGNQAWSSPIYLFNSGSRV